MKNCFKAAAVALTAIILVYIIWYFTGSSEAFSQKVREMGYDDVSETPYEVVDFTIPEEFGAVYERYNALLKKGGYDISKYKGKKCKRYTYLIPSQNARANILVCDGEIIGGDISGITIDGIMLPLQRGQATDK